MDFKMHLTGYVSDNILKIASSYDNVSEIRIRKNQKLCITSGSKNYVHNYIVSPKELEDCVTSFCKNSIHTYHEYIIQGYIPFDYGYRIGVCGNAVCENNKIINLSDITCINIPKN